MVMWALQSNKAGTHLARHYRYLRQQAQRRSLSSAVKLSPAAAALLRVNTRIPHSGNQEHSYDKNGNKNVLPSQKNGTNTNTTTNITTSSSQTKEFAWMKHGRGHLTATSVNGAASKTKSTKLTQVSHKAPMRWLPLQSSRVQKSGAAVAAMSNYGAGLLPGDVCQLEVKVQARARLGLLTQGSNRIYKQKNKKLTTTIDNTIVPAKSTLHAQVEAEGFLVVAPDPTVPFATSAFHQQQEFMVHPTSSLIAIDWFSSGRYANGERWQATRLQTETKLSLLSSNNNTQDDNDMMVPLVWDATTLDQSHHRHHLGGDADGKSSSNPFGFDLGQNSFNCFASMLLYGHESLPVVQQLQALQYQLASPYTRLRMPDSMTTDIMDTDLNLKNGTTGRVLLGVNELPTNAAANGNNNDVGPIYMARWAASSNEDLYRMLHLALKPLAPLFGLEFYQDRIRATSSGPVLDHRIVSSRARTPKVSSVDMPTQQQTTKVADLPPASASVHSVSTTTAASWNAYMLADSALPTGSFAHSAGLEAASQLGLLAPPTNEDTTNSSDQLNGDGNGNSKQQDDNENVQVFIQASTRSSLQQATPWIQAGHAVGMQCSSSNDKNDDLVSQLVDQWLQLDCHVHSVMVCQAPACRASLDQGRNLIRVGLPWLQAAVQGGEDSGTAVALLQAVQERIALTKNSAATSGHVAPLFGIISSALGLTMEEACHLMGFCVARDIASAAVRLNLVGPLAGVGVLAKAQAAAQEGIQIIKKEEKTDGITGNDSKDLLWTNTLQGGCAPVVDAIHPCHDLLAVRLFRT